MSPEQEAELFKSLGRIESLIDNCITSLTAHTVQDSVNFQKIDDDLEALKLAAAHKAGVEQEAARYASTAGGKMGAAVSLVVSGLVAGLAAYFGK